MALVAHDADLDQDSGFQEDHGHEELRFFLDFVQGVFLGLEDIIKLTREVVNSEVGAEVPRYARDQFELLGRDQIS